MAIGSQKRRLDSSGEIHVLRDVNYVNGLVCLVADYDGDLRTSSDAAASQLVMALQVIAEGAPVEEPGSIEFESIEHAEIHGIHIAQYALAKIARETLTMLGYPILAF
jgi:hypothetical protein